MSTNRIITVSSVIIILLLIVIPTAYKVVKNHYNHLYRVVESKIVEAAKKCYFDDMCEEHITLNELYNLKLLDKMSDPISKEYFNPNSYVEVKDNDFKFIIEK